MSKLLRVGAETFDLGPRVVMEGLFATISYRLEPNGRGSRFPIVMSRLYNGSLPPGDAAAASRELEEIDAALAALPADRVVWGLSDLRRRDDSHLPVNRSARNTRDYFVAGDGRPLVTVLRDATSLSAGRNEPITLASSIARGDQRKAWELVAIGFVWAVVGYIFFPTWIVTAPHGLATRGPLIWPAGILFGGCGMAALVTPRYPAIEVWFKGKEWLIVLLVLATLGLYFWLAWR